MKQHRSGTTLVELLLYMAIFSLIMISITELFVAVLSIKREAEAVSTVEQDGRFLLNRIAYDVRRADSISLPASTGASGSTLRLVIGAQQYTYAINGTTLELTDANGTAALNGSETQISNFTVIRRGNTGVNKKDTVTVSYDVTSDTQKTTGAEVKSFSTTITLR